MRVESCSNPKKSSSRIKSKILHTSKQYCEYAMQLNAPIKINSINDIFYEIIHPLSFFVAKIKIMWKSCGKTIILK